MASAQLENSKFVRLNNDKIPLHSLNDTYTFDEVRNLENLAILVDEPYVVFDIDDTLEFVILKKIIERENVKCRIMQTSRGGHIWFKSILPYKNIVGSNTPLSIHVDVRSHGKKSLVKVKDSGEWREWLRWDEDVDDVPIWLTPINHQYQFVNSRSGDGRNSELFSFIITLTNAGITKEQIRQTYHLINEYVFAEKLSSEELNTILRDEAFDKIKPAFFKQKRFLHDVFSKYFKNENFVYSKHNRLFMYDDGYYSDQVINIERRMIKYIPELSKQQRGEVLSYLKLIAGEPKSTSPYHVVCSNGLLDIRDKTLNTFTASIFISNKLDVNYEETAYDPHVDNVLNKICKGDEMLRRLLEEMMGYCLIPTTKFQKAFILYGDGANGKSTFLDMLISFLGERNISSLSLKELNHNFKLAEITSKLANIGDDISDEFLTDSSIFKKLVTGEEITVDKKNEQPYKLRNHAKMIFAANTIPNTYDKSSGMLRRMSIIPFNAVFTKNDPDYDPFIIDKITSDNAKSYILNLALDGIIRVFENNGFTEPQVVKDVIEEYAKENNNVIQFMDSISVEGRDSASVYNDYKFWCIENGVMAFKIRRFNQEVRKHSSLDLVIERQGGKTVQVWRQI